MKNITVAEFLDLSKAFDSISHELMIQKQSILGFLISAQNMLACYLSNRQLRVTINDIKPRWIEMAHRVPQGTVSDPLLFSLNAYDISSFAVM